MFEVLAVIIQKSLLLDEVEEDQPVEQNGSIEFLILFILEALDLTSQLLSLIGDVFVEPVGDLLRVERGAHPFTHSQGRKVAFLLEAE